MSDIKVVAQNDRYRRFITRDTLKLARMVSKSEGISITEAISDQLELASA